MAVTPSLAMHSTISGDSYRAGLRWWLGLPLMESTTVDDAPTCPGCCAAVDVFGDHLLCCPRNNFSRRHNAVQESLACLLTEAGQPFSREVVIPDCPEGQLRPADLLLRCWLASTDVAVDLTVCHGWQVSEQSVMATAQTRERWRVFLNRKERAKKDKYVSACRSAGWAFLPMAFGTWGGMGPEACKLLSRVVARGAAWLDGGLRTRRQEELRQMVGLALIQHIWKLLDAKNLIQ